MKGLITRLSTSLLDVLLPISCLGCGRQGRFLCDTCVAGLPRLVPPYCSVCCEPYAGRLCDGCAAVRPAVDGIRAPYIYAEGSLVQKAVVEFKYHNMRAIAPELARLMAEYMSANPLPGDVVVPVPMHSGRLRSRGYNQAALLAREVGKLAGLPVNEGVIVRTKAPQAQARTASREERLKNVAGNFASAGRLEGESVLLLDDIATTGGTLSACAEALKEAGASQVWGLVFARTA